MRAKEMQANGKKAKRAKATGQNPEEEKSESEAVATETIV